MERRTCRKSPILPPEAHFQPHTLMEPYDGTHYLFFIFPSRPFSLFLPTLVLKMDLFTDPPAASASASASVPPTGRTNNAAAKNRSACDRCHSQKLRCIRKTGQVTCERCLKLKTICRFSPRAPRASLKPSEQATGYDQGYWHDPLSMSASTPSLWNMHANSTIANLSDNNWNFPPDSERSLAEGLGKCCHVCLQSNLFEITCCLQQP
jgi:hypothetical protein